MLRLASSLLLLALAATAARADPAGPPSMPAQSQPAMIRVGNHPGFGRVVVDLPPGVTASAVADGPGAVRVRLSGGTFGPAPHPPHNVESISVQGSEARLTLAPEATYTAVALVAHLVIDVTAGEGATLVPPKGQKGATAAAPPVAPLPVPPVPPKSYFAGPVPKAGKLPNVITPASPPTPVPVPAAAPPDAIAASGSPESVHVPLQRLLEGNLPNVLRPSGASKPPVPEAAQQPAMTAPVAPVEQAALPAPGTAMPTPAGGGGPLAIAVQPDSGALLLPFAATTGAAAFQRGDETVVVFDERRPLDLAALRDDPALAAGFANARIQELPEATVLRLTLPPGAGVKLSRTPDGWALARATPPPAATPIRSDVADGAVRIQAAAPGAVVSVPDPQTGGALLVGTLTKPGQGVPLTRRTPDFTLLETEQGVVVDPLSDGLTLRVAPAKQFAGFVLASERGSVGLDPLGPEAVAALEAARMTRCWDFPSISNAALARRLQAATADAAAAPPQGRTARRLAAVQAMLALGLGAEAEALANLAVAEDARAADSPDATGLAAVGALLEGRLDETAALADPRLDGSDEVGLWRAARLAAQHEGSPEAAAGFAAAMPLLLAYPDALRQRLLPLAVETMALGGEHDAAARLLDARKDDDSLDFARALLAERDGHAAPALAIYDRLAQSPDRKLRARAGVRAAELRLRTGAFTTAQAADALDGLIYAWRGDKRELDLRMRVVDLRAQSGNWRAGLALLRDTAQSDFGPDAGDLKPALHARMADVFGQAMAGDAKASISPIDLVSLIDENPDLLPDGEAGRALAARLADRLVALDLPNRAEPVLQKLMAATPTGAAKAELGARLAAMHLDLHDPTGALEALSASVADNLPPPLTEARTIAFARATAARGALEPATAALAALDSPAADETRASLLEQAKDWPGATAALMAYAGKTVPAQGMLGETPAQVLLRLASAAAQAGDETILAQLRDRELPRIPPGKTADLLRVLTERPVQGVSDLPRAAKEAALARGVPDALRTLGVVATIP